MICLTLNGHSMLENEEIFRNSGHLADAFELRADFLDLSDVSEIAKASAFPSITEKPVILTLRRKSDGGNYSAKETERLDVMKKIAEGCFSYVDLENDFYNHQFENSLKERRIRVIRSYHNMECMPENSAELIKDAASCGDIPKLSVRINGIADLERLFRLKDECADIEEKIIVGMGDYGVPSRILYRSTGSFLMYCSKENIAPGMLDAYRMKNLYRADKLSFSTNIYGLIGNPVSQSLSPQIHNGGFEKLNLDAVYIPFTVDSVSDFFSLADYLNINGFSVTAPFKGEVLRFLSEMTSECKSTGACNTVVRTGGKWKGYNTDYEASAELFKGKKAIVIGAGGAAEAVVKSLSDNSTDITVFNRTFSKSKKLADEMGCEFDNMENLSLYSYKADVVVKAVSTAEDTATDYRFSGRETVCDLYYKPEMTPFLLRAEKAGCKIITGVDFLKIQGKFQFELFTGLQLP